jgi:hypothetical protein
LLAVLTTWSVAVGATSAGEHGTERGVHGAAASDWAPGIARMHLGEDA